MAKKTSKKPAFRTTYNTPNTPRSARPAVSEAGKTGPMDVPLLEKLVGLMSEHGLSSLELQDGEQRISLQRGTTSPPAPTASAGPAVPAADAKAPSSPGPTTTPVPADNAAATAGLKEIPSPMVGTFYAAPNPDAAPFVTPGNAVTPDTDVCVIEAMKVFNTIKAETSGTIERVLIENGQPVEYGQPLFLVRPG